MTRLLISFSSKTLLESYRPRRKPMNNYVQEKVSWQDGAYSFNET